MTHSALILIDIQNDYFPSFDGAKMALPNMEAATANAALLLDAARKAGTPIFHIRHVMSSDAAPFFHPGTKGAQLSDDVAPRPGEAVIDKTKPNSFIGTGLEQMLRAQNITALTLCGAMSQMCVDATTRAASDLGFAVTLAHDACAAANVTFDGVDVPAAQVHAAIMAPLASSYAKVKATQDCL